MEECGKAAFWFYQRPDVLDTDRKTVSVVLPQCTSNILGDVLNAIILSMIFFSHATEIQVSSQTLFLKSDFLPLCSSHLTALPNLCFNNFFAIEKFKLL